MGQTKAFEGSSITVSNLVRHLTCTALQACTRSTVASHPLLPHAYLLGGCVSGGLGVRIALSCPRQEESLKGRRVAPLPPPPHAKKRGAVGAMPPSPLSLKTRGGGALDGGGGGRIQGQRPAAPPGGPTSRHNESAKSQNPHKSAEQIGEIQKPNKSAEQIGEVSRIQPSIWGEGLAVRSRISWDTCKPHARHQRPVDLRTDCSMRPKDALGGQPLLPGVTTSGFVALALWFVLPVSSMSVVGTTGGGFYCWRLKLQTMRMRT